MAETEIYGQFPPGRWIVGDFSMTFPVTSVRVDRENAIAKHKRLYRDGQRLDDTGGLSLVITVTGEYHNGTSDPFTEAAYPDDADKFEKSADIHEMGELRLPNRAPMKARLEKFTRLDHFGERDCAAFQWQWIQDVPDDEVASQWQAPSASSVASRYAEEMIVEFDKLGIDGDPFGDLISFADQLTELASAPQSYVDAVEQRVDQVTKAVARVEEAYTSGAVEAVDEVTKLLTDPLASRAGRLLIRLGDTMASALSSQVGPSIITRVYEATVTIFDVAQKERQDVTKLIKINQGLPNLLAIAPKTPVRVFASTATARR